MKTVIKDQFLVSPFLVLFLIHGMQYGVGVLSFQRDIAKFVGHDAWISILLSGNSCSYFNLDDVHDAQ